MRAQKPEELDVLFTQCLKEGDLEGLVSLYEPAAAFPNQSGEVKSGLPALREEMAPFAAMKPELKSNITKVVVAGDIALIHNEWTMPAQSMSGYAIEVARRQSDGSWKFIIDDPFTVGSRVAAPASA
jgi:ketosteroid isomerase-like protein